MEKILRQQRGLEAITPYVPGKPIEEVQREYGLTDVIKLASNENPLGPSPKALAALKEALPHLNLYPDGQSYYLRQALAEYLSVPMDQVTVGNGADGIILQSCLAYLDEECEVIVSHSSFPVYDIYTHTMRAKVVKTSLKNYGLDLEAMARAINARTKIIFVCNPNNPTGKMVTAREVEAFMKKVPDHVLVVFDEAYYEFVDSKEFPDTLAYIRQGKKNVMALRTFSKIYGLAGIRLGYAVASPEILEPLNKVKEPFAVNLLAQVAGIAALQDKKCLKASVRVNREGRLYLYCEFERLGLFYVESHTNFIIVKIGPQSGKVLQMLLQKGIIVRSCTGYDLPEFMRITVGDKAQNARLIETLQVILKNLGLSRFA